MKISTESRLSKHEAARVEGEDRQEEQATDWVREYQPSAAISSLFSGVGTSGAGPLREGVDPANAGRELKLQPE